jgi:hypothetical protein
MSLLRGPAVETASQLSTETLAKGTENSVSRRLHRRHNHERVNQMLAEFELEICHLA